MMREGLKEVATGMYPMNLKRGIDKAVGNAVDALQSTRAAVEEGVVPGGGVALVGVLKHLKGLEGENEDQTVGIAIARRAMPEPMRQIVANAGAEPSVVQN